LPHVHSHVPHELTEVEGGRPTSRRERILEFAAVLLLSLTALATAWSGYQAAHWSGEQSKAYAQASADRIKAQHLSTHAGQVRISDLLYFNNWLNARFNGQRGLAQIYEHRFRPGFTPVFRAWLAQRPFTNPDAVSGPLYMPQYHLEGLGLAAEEDHKADDHFDEGTEAKSYDDDYILSTVFFAAVLFFAGISLRLEWLRLRIAVIILASIMLISGLVFVATLPVA
jgi:hypothetical protein